MRLRSSTLTYGDNLRVALQGNIRLAMLDLMQSFPVLVLITYGVLSR